MSLTVTSGATSYALTTVTRVKTELGIDTYDFSKDEYLKAVINEASDIMANETGRTFVKQTYLETLSGNNRPVLMLRKFPVISVSKVVYCGTTLASSSYNIQDASVGFLYKRTGWIDTPILSGGWSATQVGVEQMQVGSIEPYSVTYSAGWVAPTTASTAITRTLPYDVEQATVTLVSASYNALGRDPMVKMERTGDSIQSLFDVPYGVKVITGLPASVYRIIEKYKVTV